MTESSPPTKQKIGPVTRRLVRRFAGAEDASLDRVGRSAAYALVEGYVSVVLNLVLFAIKLTFGLLTGSISLIADAVGDTTTHEDRSVLAKLREEEE